MNAQFAQGLVKDALAAQGMALWPMSSAELDAHIRAESATWARVIKTRKFTAE